jgi:hypothetical protein
MARPGKQQWQHVAESYQRIESLERLLLDHRSLPPEDEKLPKDFPQNRRGHFDIHEKV